MANRLWTQLSSSVPALLLACLMMGTFATTHAVRAAEIAYERTDSSASKQLQRLRDDAQDGSALAQYVLGA
jgi:hypothetical protein